MVKPTGPRGSVVQGAAEATGELLPATPPRRAAPTPPEQTVTRAKPATRNATARPEAKPEAPRPVDLSSAAAAGATYDRLTTRLGQVGARHLLALALSATKTIPGEVEAWLRERMASGRDAQANHLASLLHEVTGGAQWLDVDGDGAPSAGDFVTRDGAVTRLDDTTRERVNLASVVVRAALDYSAMGHPYGATELNPALWEPAMSQMKRDGRFIEYTGPLVRESETPPTERNRDGIEGWHTYSQTFIIRNNVRPSAAVNDLFATRQTQECATAKHAIYLKAILDVIGAERFDRAFPGLALGPFAGDLQISRYLTAGSPVAHGTHGLVPGDAGYIENPDVTPEAEGRRGPGENVIYVGGGRFVGHPIGIMTYDQIVTELNAERVPEATRPAHMKEGGRLVLDPDTINGIGRDEPQRE